MSKVFAIQKCQWVVCGKNGSGRRVTRQQIGLIADEAQANKIRSPKSVRENQDSDAVFYDVEVLTVFADADSFNKEQEMLEQDAELRSIAGTNLTIERIAELFGQERADRIAEIREVAKAEREARKAEKEAEKAETVKA